MKLLYCILSKAVGLQISNLFFLYGSSFNLKPGNNKDNYIQWVSSSVRNRLYGLGSRTTYNVLASDLKSSIPYSTCIFRVGFSIIMCQTEVRVQW